MTSRRDRSLRYATDPSMSIQERGIYMMAEFDCQRSSYALLHIETDSHILLPFVQHTTSGYF
jgi:hypothetical protein